MSIFRLTENQVKQIEIIQSFDTLFSIDGLIKVIEITNNVNGCKICSINEYSSAVSGNTEMANHLVNIGANYGVMREKSILTYHDVKYMQFVRCVLNFNYSKYVVDDLKQLQKDILKEYPIALNALQNPKTKDISLSNDMVLNKIVLFNTNTKIARITGQSLKKTITVAGEFKAVKSKPLTICKDILKYMIAPPTSLIRGYNLGEMRALKVLGEKMYLGEHEKYN